MQLYNRKKDIGEEDSLIEEYPQKVDSLVELLEAFVEKGRSTLGSIQTNDAVIDIWKKQKNQKK